MEPTASFLKSVITFNLFEICICVNIIKVKLHKGNIRRGVLQNSSSMCRVKLTASLSDGSGTIFASWIPHCVRRLYNIHELHLTLLP